MAVDLSLVAKVLTAVTAYIDLPPAMRDASDGTGTQQWDEDLIKACAELVGSNIVADGRDDPMDFGDAIEVTSCLFDQNLKGYCRTATAKEPVLLTQIGDDHVIE